MANTLQKTYKQRKLFVALGQWLMVCAMILSCNTMWVTLAPHDVLVKNLATVALIVGVLIAVAASGAFFQTGRLVISVAYVGVFAVYLLLWLYLTDYAHRPFLKTAVLFLALLFYYLMVEERTEIPKLLLFYERLMVVIAAFSILCWLIFSVFRLFPPGMPGMTWWNGTDHYTEVTNFYGIYFEPQTRYLFGTDLARNCGFFTEAPMASFHFNVALLIDLFLRKKTSKVHSGLLLLAILTTFSDIGYLIAALAIILRILSAIFGSERYARLGKDRKRSVNMLVFLLLVFFVILCLFLIRKRIGGLSWTVRMEDFKAAFQAWLDHPLYGNGIYNFDAVKVHFSAERAASAGYSSTTALGTILADGGIALGLLYIGSFVCAVIKTIRNREFPILFFSVLIFLLFSVTIVAYDAIILFLFLFFGAYRCKSRAYFERKVKL